MNILEVQNIHVAYGESEVCHDVSFHVNQGEILCILGRNGVGKTTSMKAIMGIVPATKGKIIFKGQDITRLRPYQIARLGIGYVPQGRMIFPQMTVEENLQSGTLVLGKGCSRFRMTFLSGFPSCATECTKRAARSAAANSSSWPLPAAWQATPTLSCSMSRLKASSPISCKNPGNHQADQPREGDHLHFGRAKPQVLPGLRQQRLYHGNRFHPKRRGYANHRHQPQIQQYLTFKA